MNTTARRTVVTLVAVAMTLGIALPAAAQDGSRLERVQDLTLHQSLFDRIFEYLDLEHDITDRD